MTYIELKTELTNLQKSNAKIHCQGFEESLEFAHFKIFYELKDEPHYALLQARTNKDFQTTEDMWYLTYLKDGQRIVLDIADECTICDELYQLMVIWFQGCQKITLQEK